MDSQWITPALGLLGVLIGGAGTLVVQRLGFQHIDAGVRREMRTRLRRALQQLTLPPEYVWLLPLRECLSKALDRGRQTDVATAFNDDQHFALSKAIDGLQDLLHHLDSELRDLAFRDQIPKYDLKMWGKWVPSDDDYLLIDERFREKFSNTFDIVAAALVALGDSKFVEWQQAHQARDLNQTAVAPCRARK